MMMRLVAAALVGAAAAVKVTSRNALVYSTVTPKLRLQGEGFAGDGTNIHLTFVPALDPAKYSVLVTSETSLSVLLKGSATWPLGEGLSESSVFDRARDDTQGDSNLLDEPVVAATC